MSSEVGSGDPVWLKIQIRLIISSRRRKVRLPVQVVEGGHAHTPSRNWSATRRAINAHHDMPDASCCYQTMSDHTRHISGLIDNIGAYVPRRKHNGIRIVSVTAPLER